MSAATCPVSYCSNPMNRGETVACTPCLRRCPRSLRRDVYAANHYPERVAGGDPAAAALRYLEDNPRGVPRPHGRPHRRSTR